ncbi:MAG: BadF/BadG/BcrA/BcrD ATPase family protein [Bryobacterales bacterium]|nr:ATPase [Bryobacteraceae bacterium]MDW8128949.1 BadF/BadG/BcrA/BcrD ATPase family protein [Bryobacterales bacterium]
MFLGVDGGQTATVALIGDESGRVLGAGRGGPCNHVGGPEGREKFTRAIRDSVGEACRNAGLDPETTRFRVACLGFSGGPEDKRALLGQMLAADRLIVTTDALIALSGATAGEPGIIAIAGTGSIAFGRNAQGRTARAGGWGYLFGDEGGGFDLVRRALRAALRYEEGWGPPTTLRERLLEATGAASANDLLHRFYTSEYPRPRIASFAVLVDRAATEGDPVARAILQDAAGELASLVEAVRRQLFSREESVRVAYVGGVFRSRLLLERFAELVRRASGSVCQPPAFPPAAGALLEAWRAAGLHPRLSGLPDSLK